MSKYDKLQNYLESKKTGLWHARFSEIEKILEFDLPKSARTYPAWWSNEKSMKHVQCVSWLDIRWETSNLNLNKETVVFTKHYTK